MDLWIKLIPNDTLFFRTGRPFTMGAENWTDIIFPPHPSTIYGALRTFLLFHRGSLKDFRKGYSDIGSPDQKGTLQILGPFLTKEESGEHTVLFQVPLDTVERKTQSNQDQQRTSILSKIRKPEFFISDLPFDDLLINRQEEQVEEAGGFLDIFSLKDYLRGSKQTYSYLKTNDVYIFENKIGIARDNLTLSSKEGYLYRIPMIRLSKEYGILVKISGVSDDMPEKGVLQLGGEGKTAYYEKLNKNPLESLESIEPKLNDGIFKIYLATPAIFENGWIPKWINKNNLEGEYKGLKLKLVSCAIGKYSRVGGWDIARGEPKDMYKAVPAGSVYYFKVLDPESDKISEKINKVFHLKNISDINSEEGFGLSLVGSIL